MSTNIEELRPGGLELTDELLSLYPIKENSKILDIGCGSGVSVDYLLNKQFKAIGIDTDIDIIKTNKSKLDLRIMDAHSMSFDENEFDIVICECSLSVMKNPKNVLKECNRILKKDGIMLISDIYLRSSNRYSTQFYEAIFEDAGFKMISFIDKSNLWKEYVAKVIWNYGSMDILFRGCENEYITCNCINKKPGYFISCIQSIKGE